MVTYHPILDVLISDHLHDQQNSLVSWSSNKQNELSKRVMNIDRAVKCLSSGTYRAVWNGHTIK